MSARGNRIILLSFMLFPHLYGMVIITIFETSSCSLLGVLAAMRPEALSPWIFQLRVLPY